MSQRTTQREQRCSQASLRHQSARTREGDRESIGAFGGASQEDLLGVACAREGGQKSTVGCGREVAIGLDENWTARGGARVSELRDALNRLGPEWDHAVVVVDVLSRRGRNISSVLQGADLETQWTAPRLVLTGDEEFGEPKRLRAKGGEQ